MFPDAHGQCLSHDVNNILVVQLRHTFWIVFASQVEVLDLQLLHQSLHVGMQVCVLNRQSKYVHVTITVCFVFTKSELHRRQYAKHLQMCSLAIGPTGRRISTHRCLPPNPLDLLCEHGSLDSPYTKIKACPPSGFTRQEYIVFMTCRNTATISKHWCAVYVHTYPWSNNATTHTHAHVHTLTRTHEHAHARTYAHTCIRIVCTNR